MRARTDGLALLIGGAGPADRSEVLAALMVERFGTVRQLERESHTRPSKWPEDTPAMLRRRRRTLLEWE